MGGGAGEGATRLCTLCEMRPLLLCFPARSGHFCRVSLVRPLLPCLPASSGHFCRVSPARSDHFCLVSLDQATFAVFLWRDHICRVSQACNFCRVFLPGENQIHSWVDRNVKASCRQHSERDQIAFFGSSICTGASRNSATCGANQRN